MKKIIVVLMLLVMISAVSACKKDQEDDAVISFAWWGTSDRNIATYEAIALFEETYPQYTVVADQSPWQGYQQTLNNRLNRGTEADVFQINYNWVYSMYGIDYFMDINDLGLDLSEYPATEHDPLTVDGKILGLSVSETGYVFYLNKTVYQNAGITTIPETWDELMDAGLEIQDKTPGHYAIGRLDAQQVAMLMFTWLAQGTGKNVIENNQLNFDKDEIVSAFHFISDLRSSGVLISSNTLDTHSDGPTNPNWTSQKYGGLMTWNTAISEYANTLPDQGQNLVMAGMFQQSSDPDDLYGMYKKVSMAYAVSKRVEASKEKQEAVRTFLEFMTTNPEAVRILGVDRGVSNNQSTQQILESATDRSFRQTLEWLGHDVVQTSYQAQINKGIDLYIHPYYEHATFRAIYESPIENFLLNRMTANEAATQIVNRFDLELARIIGG